MPADPRDEAEALVEEIDRCMEYDAWLPAIRRALAAARAEEREAIAKMLDTEADERHAISAEAHRRAEFNFAFRVESEVRGLRNLVARIRARAQKEGE